MLSNICALLAGMPTKWLVLWKLKAFWCSLCIRYQCQNSNWLMAEPHVFMEVHGSNSSSAKQWSTHGKTSHSHESGSNSIGVQEEAMASINSWRYSCFDTGGCSVAFKKPWNFLRHDEQLSVENIFNQAIPAANATAQSPFPPSNPFIWYSKCFGPFDKTAIPYRVSHGHLTSPWVVSYCYLSCWLNSELECNVWYSSI